MNLYELQQKIYEEINKNAEEGLDEYLEGRTNGLNFALDLLETLISEAEEHVTEGLYGCVGSDNEAYFHLGRLEQLRLTLGEKPE